jgi:choline kinase
VDISKDMDPVEADGENVGIVKFGPSGSALLLEYMNALIASGSRKDWAPRAFREFALHHPLYALSTRRFPWIEIDFPEDYQRAVNEIFPKIEAQAGIWAAVVTPSLHPAVTTFDEP